jgi:penicillin amidase
VASGSLWRLINLLNDANARPWCNDIATGVEETCGEVLVRTLESALEDLSEHYGEGWSHWRWCEAHKTKHSHRPFSMVAGLDRLFTIRQIMDGGRYTLLRNSNRFSNDEPYVGTHGAAMTALHDLSDPNGARFILPTGQSGNAVSKHYDDMRPLWADVKDIQVPIDPDRYDQGGEGVLFLSQAPHN